MVFLIGVVSLGAVICFVNCCHLLSLLAGCGVGFGVIVGVGVGVGIVEVVVCVVGSDLYFCFVLFVVVFVAFVLCDVVRAGCCF